LRDAVSAGLMDLEHPDALPLGLVGLYERWFRRQFPSAAAYADCRSFFEVLAAAEHPVPESWFERIFGWSKQDQAKVFEQVGSLVERRADGVLPFHKSLLDWLIDDSRAGADFIIDPKVGARCLQSALWTEFLAWIEQPGNVRLDPFCRDELLVQLTGTNGEPGQLREFARVLGDPEIIRRRMLVGTAASEDTRRQARHAFAELVWQSASVWPKGVDAAPLQECAIAMANVAWETWEALRSRRLKPQPPHYNEPSECIFLLVTAVRIAWGPAAVQVVLDQRLMDLIFKFYDYEWRGFRDYMGIAGPDADSTFSALEYEVEQTLRRYKDHPGLVGWASEWSDFLRHHLDVGYWPRWLPRHN
jgi:hypothetical protein